MIIYNIKLILTTKKIYHDLLVSKGGIKKRPVFVVFDYEGVRTPPAPPIVVLWESEILGRYFMLYWMPEPGLETDFTIETNRKRMKEKLQNST